MSGEPAVILDINNNGWDPRLFYAFHCSQTPANWFVDGGHVSDGGYVGGDIGPVPFTGISAGTSSDAFNTLIFNGQFLPSNPARRGSGGWAFVPNLPEVLKGIEQTGIHHFVALKGRLGAEVAGALRFRGIVVNDLSCEVPPVEEIEDSLPDPQDGRGQVAIFSQ
jgi:hypothetical protein